MRHVPDFGNADPFGSWEFGFDAFGDGAVFTVVGTAD